MHVRYNNLTYEAEEGEAGETLQKQISQLEERINQMDDAHKSIESAMEFLMAVAA
jgi:prefoldin subunit 5